MRTATFVIALTLLAAALVPGQKLDIRLPESLGANAKEKAEVVLDADMIALGKNLAGSKMPKELTDKIGGVKELRVWAYEYDKAGQYSPKDLEALRKQVGPGSGWSSIVSVKDKEDTVDILVHKQGDRVGGLLLIVAEPKELVVVHILGDMPVAALQEVVKSTVAWDLNSIRGARQ